MSFTVISVVQETYSESEPERASIEFIDWHTGFYYYLQKIKSNFISILKNNESHICYEICKFTTRDAFKEIMIKNKPYHFKEIKESFNYSYFAE